MSKKLSYETLKERSLRIRQTDIRIRAIKEILDTCPEISAAYLFGSAATGQPVVNDLDILVLLGRDIDGNEAYSKIVYKLSQKLKVSEDCIDLVLFDLDEVDPMILAKGVNQGVLLKNEEPDYLGDMIDQLSRFFLTNEVLIRQGRQLRKERVEKIDGH